MKRLVVLGVLLGMIVTFCACASQGQNAATTSTTITKDVDACAAIDNQVLGRYKNLSVKDQNLAGQDMLDRALSASNPALVRDAKLLRSAAQSHDLQGMDADLGKLALDCDHLKIGPEQEKTAGS